MIPENLVAAAKAQRASDFVALEKIARDLIARAADEEDLSTLGNAYAYLGAALVGFNDGPGARSAFTRSREYLERVGDEMGVVRALNGLAVAAMDLDLHASTAREYIDAALPIARRATGTDRLWLSILLGNRSEVERFEGDYRASIASARESLRTLIDLNENARAAWQLTNIAHCLFLDGDAAAAVKTLRDAYGHLCDEPDPRMVGWYYDVWIIVAAGLGYGEAAVRILGFLATFRARNGLMRLPLLLPWTAPVISKLSRKYSEDTYERLVTEGSELSLEAVETLTQSIAARSLAESVPRQRLG